MGEKDPNDQRSDVKNPTSDEHQDDLDNRSRQLNPEDPVYESSREEPSDDEGSGDD